MREGGEDLQGLLSDFLLSVLRHRGQCPHIVQTVCQFDDHDTQVFRHRQEDFAKIGRAFIGLAVAFLAGDSIGGFGQGRFYGRRRIDTSARLGFVAGLEVGQFQLGDPVYEVGDLLAELRSQLVARDAAVFDDIMEQAGGECGVVHFQFSEYQSDREGMRDVRFAGAAGLPLMLLGGVGIGAAQQVGIHMRMIRLCLLDELFDRVVVHYRRLGPLPVLRQHPRQQRCSSYLTQTGIGLFYTCLHAFPSF